MDAADERAAAAAAGGMESGEDPDLPTPSPPVSPISEIRTGGRSEHWAALPADFRVQLQLLEHAAQHGRLLQHIAEQQRCLGAQLTSIRKQGTQQQGTQARVADLVGAQREELRSVREETRRMRAMMEESPAGRTRSWPLNGKSTEVPLNNHCGRPAEVAGSDVVAPCAVIPEFPEGRMGPRPSNGFEEDQEELDLVQSIHEAAEQVAKDLTELELSPREKLRKEKKPGYLQGKCLHMVSSPKFDAACATVIMLNAATIGVTSQLDIQMALFGTSPPMWLEVVLRILKYFFVVFYAGEFFLRLFAQRWDFFRGPDWKWNLFDMILVVTAFLELMTELFQLDYGGQSATWMRLLRLVKMLKMLRVVRMMRFFRELRMILSSIVGSIGTLMWSLVMLGLMNYAFGLCFLQAVTAYVDESRAEIGDETLALIVDYWSSVSQSTITLYMAVTGGSDWEPLAKPVRACGFHYYTLFLFYIAFSMVAVLNVLTGMFVDCAMKVSDVDQGSVLDEILDDPQEVGHILEFRRLLVDCDRKGKGEVSWDDILRVLDSTPDFARTFLKSLGVQPLDLKRVFQSLVQANHGNALVHDCGGKANADEFISACTRVGLESTGIGVVALTTETRKQMSQIVTFMHYVEERFDEIEEKLVPLGRSPANGRVSIGSRLSLRGKQESQSR